MAKAPSNKITAGDIQDLAIAVEQLTEETRLLRMSLDEIRDDVIWAARQVLAAGYWVTGTPQKPPIDPLAFDVRGDDDQETDTLTTSRFAASPAQQQGNLFE